MAVAAKPRTLREFLELPGEEPALEFVDGATTQKVSPKGMHSALQTELAERFNQAGRHSRLARAFTELRTTFSGASRVPDIAVYRWDRIPADEAGQLVNDFMEAPDIAVEIVSPEQSVTALVRRCLWYVDHGVTIALLVDPKDASVLVFRSNAEPRAWRGNDHMDLSEVIPDFELSVEELFATLRVR